MNASVEDVIRIMLEQQAIAEKYGYGDHREHADEWAEENGMEMGTMAAVCNGIMAAFQECVMDLTREEVGDNPETTEIDGVECVEATPSAYQASMEMTILSAFRWGFETARQLR